MAIADEQQLVRSLYELATGRQRVQSTKLLELLEPFLPQRYSMCVCGEPLVTSLAVRGNEWVCVVCARYYRMFEPGDTAATPALHLRFWELRDQLAERRKAGYETPRAEAEALARG